MTVKDVWIKTAQKGKHTNNKSKTEYNMMVNERNSDRYKRINIKERARENQMLKDIMRLARK